ncbi:hypothetical protein FRC0195_01963 [Corynebacterium diphtheriae]|nr:hypothetical protein FRC0195_01963 [Corynebacterium diphtheriae]
MGLSTGQPANGTKIDFRKLPEVDVNGTPTGKVTKVAIKKTEGGATKFDNLEPALYFVVQELNGTEAVVLSQPFMVAAPQTKPTGNGWLQDVHVYPKHQALFEPVKTAEDPDATQPSFSVERPQGKPWLIKVANVSASTLPLTGLNRYLRWRWGFLASESGRGRRRHA